MLNWDKLRQMRRDAHARDAKATLRFGLTGKLDSGQYTLDVPSKTGYFYVREVSGDAVIGVVEAINGDRGVARKPNIPVRLDFNDKRELEIFGLNQREAALFAGQFPGSLGVPPHSHNIGSGNELIVETRMLQDGLTFHRSGDPALTIYVAPFKYKDSSGNDTYWPGGTIDLTGYRPGSAGTKGWVKVGLDRSAGTLVAAAGTAVALVAPLGEAELAAIAFTNYIPTAGVILRNGQSASPVEADFLDARILIDSGGGSGSSPLTTKGDLYTYDTADARLPVGTNNYVLTADSTQAKGIKWALVDLVNSITGILGITNGGTGASSASGARTSLGLGTIATQDANNVAVTGGAINGTAVGTTTPAAGYFSALRLKIGGFFAIFSHGNSADRTYTLPDYDGTLATLAGTETLTNKTLTSPTLGDSPLLQTTYEEVKEGSAPASPAAGYQRLFIDSASHHLKRKDSGGATTDLESGGTVTSVTASAPLASSGGSTPNISHNTSGAVAGSYSAANITIDSTGHVTAASDGTGGGTVAKSYASRTFAYMRFF